MKHSETLGGLATALSKAQAEMGTAQMDAKNPHFKSKYASLQSIDNVIRPIATKHGLSWVQGTKETAYHITDQGMTGWVTVVTTMLHESGEWISFEMPVPLGRQGGPQGAVGALTFGRRAGLKAIFGIVEEDDDGEDLHGRGTVQRARPAPRVQQDEETVIRMLESTGSVDGCREIFARHIKTLPPGEKRERLSKMSKARAVEIDPSLADSNV